MAETAKFRKTEELPSGFSAAQAQLMKSPNLYGAMGVLTAPLRPIETAQNVASGFRAAGKAIFPGWDDPYGSSGNAYGISDAAATSINQQGGFMPLSPQAQTATGQPPGGQLTGEQVVALAPPTPGLRLVPPPPVAAAAPAPTPAPVQSFRPTPVAAVSPDFVPAPVTRGPDTNGFGSMRISGSPVVAGPERVADTRLGMRGYTVPNPNAAGSVLPAETGDFQVNAGLDMSRRGAYGSTEGTGGTVNVMESPEQALAFRNQERVAAGLKAIDSMGREIDPTVEAGKLAAVDLVNAQAGKFRAEAAAEPVKAAAAQAKVLADLNKAPDAPKVGLTEVQDPTNPLKMNYLLTEDGVPSPTAIDPSDPIQAQALRAFTRARMEGGANARVPFDDFLRFALQQVQPAGGN